MKKHIFTTSKMFRSLRESPRLSKSKIIVSIIAFGIVGSVFIFLSHAATPTASVEPETGTLSGPVSICSDASASGGASIKFGSACKTFTNPVINQDCPDPGALRDGATYYVVCTTHTLPAFKIRTSPDLVNWTDTGKYVLNSPAPWAANDYYWAPEMHKIGSTYIVIFTARNPVTNFLCVSTASATNPLGPYTAASQPLVCANGKTALDATIFLDDTGKNYLYWKEDAAPGNPSGYLFAQQLDSTGTALAAGSSRVLLFKNDLAWEGVLVEGPWVTKNGGQYYLFYSGNSYNTAAYAIGVARSSSPLGPFNKKGPPILQSGTTWKGPGHGSTVQTPNGEDYFVYHAWQGATYPGTRELMIDPLTWSNGWPAIGNDVPTETPQPYPL